MTGIPASAESQPTSFCTTRQELTCITLARVQDTVSAERDDHTNDRNDDDTDVQADGARVDRRQNLTGSDGVDGAEAHEGDEVKE